MLFRLLVLTLSLFCQHVRNRGRSDTDMKFVGALFGVVVVDSAALHMAKILTPVFNEESLYIASCYCEIAEQVPLIGTVAPA